jgi:hypothetical protein
MSFYSKFLIIFLLSAVVSCSVSQPKRLTPLETINVYGNAFKKKNTTQMKLLLSQASLKMAEDSAKAKNTTIDEIIKSEKLFSENQTTSEYRNEKTEEAKASIEIKDSTGIWNTVQFIKEEGVWKIDKSSFANQIEQDVEQKNNELDDIINKGRQP